MKTKKILSLAAAAAVCVQTLICPTVLAEPGAVDVIASDESTSWRMNWSWERYEAGFMRHSEISTEDGLSIFLDRAKFDAVKAVAFPSKDNGLTQCEKSGEYKYVYRVSEAGELVPYDAADTESENVLWYHQGRGNYNAAFAVGETANDGRPLVISYDYYIESKKADQWNAPQLQIGSDMWFRLYVNGSQNSLVMRYNDGAGEKSKVIMPKATEDGWHSVQAVILPHVKDGRIEMTAISVDGKTEKLDGVYSLKASKTDDDIKLDRLTAVMGFEGSSDGDDTMKYRNLTVSRGIEDITLSSDFTDGEEITEEGIRVYTNIPMSSDALDGKISVFDEDFDDELIQDCNVSVKYNESNTEAVINVSGLEAGGNYRIGIDGVYDYCGINTSNSLDVRFKTARAEDIPPGDDSPADNPDTSSASVSNPRVNHNNLMHGHSFSSAEENGDIYEFRSDMAAWWAAEQARYMKNNQYYYKDENGTEILLGYGNENWNYAEFLMDVSEKENNGGFIIVSFDYNADNISGNYEWGSPYISVLGFYAYLSAKTDTQGMVKYYKDGGSTAVKYRRGEGENGWHSIKLVISPKAEDERYRLYAVCFDEYVYMTEGAYSTTNGAADETCFVNQLKLYLPSVNQTRADNGDCVLNIRSMAVERADPIKAEVYTESGQLSPKDDIKLNFNYELPQTFTAEDFSIYELDGETEKKIENPITVNKAYNGKQIVISVGNGGLYYGKKYRLDINRDIVVNNYIGLLSKSYDITMQQYPDSISVTAEKDGDTIKYSISGGNSSLFLAAVSYDENNCMTGIKTETVYKQGNDIRSKAKGNLEIPNIGSSDTVKFYVFDSAEAMNVYRLPISFDI